MIEIYRKSPNEARQGSVPGKYEHGRAQWKGLGSAILGQVDQWQGGHYRRRMVTKDD
jgi:hypothetical protein